MDNDFINNQNNFHPLSLYKWALCKVPFDVLSINFVWWFLVSEKNCIVLQRRERTKGGKVWQIRYSVSEKISSVTSVLSEWKIWTILVPGGVWAKYWIGVKIKMFSKFLIKVSTTVLLILWFGRDCLIVLSQDCWLKSCYIENMDSLRPNIFFF